MRRAFALLVVLAAVIPVASVSAAPPTMVHPFASQRTVYFTGVLQPSTWHLSSSYARRTESDVTRTDGIACLPSFERYQLAYFNQSGAMTNSAYSAYGACYGFGVNMDSGGVYVKAGVRVVSTNGPNGAQVSAASTWY